MSNGKQVLLQKSLGRPALAAAAVALLPVAALAGAADKTLHSFSGGADGAVPHAGLVMDAGGNLYGVSTDGGRDAACPASAGGAEPGEHVLSAPVRDARHLR